MSRLLQNYNKFIPLNRKERFYTGTVLPSIICYDNFKHINRFFNLIPCFNKKLTIFPDVNKNNILLQTEYSLKESIFEEEFKQKYNVNIETKDTPDIVILITEPDLILFVGEAKMFDNVRPDAIANQMKNQEWFPQALKEVLNIKKENIHHFAIVPKQLIPNKEKFGYPVVYWEEILEAYMEILENEHFYNVLKIALDKYEILKGKSVLTYGENMDEKWNGLKIIEEQNKGKRFWVGRFGGLYGGKLRNDIRNGKWQNFKYEINTSSENAPNKNWFSSEEFVEVVLGKKM